MVKKRTEPTATSIVYAALMRANDFRTGRQLQAETGLNTNRVSAALYSLLKYKAVEFIDSDNALWWFSTPENDTRSRTVDERVPESRARKPRKVKIKV
jgi:hypothetical protein